MFLHNQKYWRVNYKYSNELDEYLQSIKLFLINLIVTNQNEFKIIDISKDNILSTEQQLQYDANENIEELVNIYISHFTELLTQEVQNKIDIKLNEEIVTNKNSLFIFNKTFFYVKKRENKENSIILKIDGKLKRSLAEDNILKETILDFWQQIVNNKAMDILKVFIEHKAKEVSLIINDNEATTIDFLPVKISDINILGVKYDKNKSDFTVLQLKSINEIFSLGLDSGELIISEAHSDGKIVGLVLGDYLFFYNIYPILKDILVDNKIIKLDYLRKNILKDDTKNRGSSNKIEEFKEDIIEDDLITTLSILENNLYCNEESFPLINTNMKEKYFREGYKIESDYLDKNQIFIPYTRDAAALFGIHNNSNARTHKGIPEKGLKSWIDSSSQEQNQSSKKAYTKAKKVIHLLPEVAFYFKEKFFEDYLETILNEIKNENNNLDMEIITNKILYINTNSRITSPLSPSASFEQLQEFDFIVNYNKEDGTRTTVVIEAKTKLSKFIIQDQAEKIEKYIKYDDLNIFDKYFLVGFNSDKTVDSAMAYFIKNMSIDNTEGLGFEYPLPSTDNVLYCTASNNREQLKQNLLALFTPESQKKISSS